MLFLGEVTNGFCPEINIDEDGEPISVMFNPNHMLYMKKIEDNWIIKLVDGSCVRVTSNENIFLDYVTLDMNRPPKIEENPGPKKKKGWFK